MKFKNIQIKKRYTGGGGSPSTTSASNIPPALQPYIENVMQNAQSMFSSGALSQVANKTGSQNAAFTGGAQAIAATGGSGLDSLAEQQLRLKQIAKSGGYDTTALKDKAVLEAEKATSSLGQQYGAGGTLGSARQAVAQGAQNAQTSANFATLDRDAAQTNLQNKLTAEQGLGTSVGASSSLANSTASGLANLGSQERAVDQSKLDASWQGLQRLGSTIYGTPERQSTSQSGGGGK